LKESTSVNNNDDRSGSQSRIGENLSDTNNSHGEDYDVLAINVFDAQSKFYSRVRGTFTSETTIKVALWVVGAIMQPFILPRLSLQLINTVS
jgi:hypothetical protein